MKFSSLPLVHFFRCFNSSYFSASIFLLSAANLSAETPSDNQNDSAQPIQTIIVNGSHIPNARANVSIELNADDIQQKNSASFVDLLRGVPGLDVSQPGGAGGVTELFIRGAESNFTLVTVNGVRVNDTTNSHGGAFDLSTINPDDIQSVEILKGPSSSAYGSDALAGALNIVTQKPHAGTQVKVRHELGEEGFSRSYLSLNLGNQEIAGNLRASRSDSGDIENGSSAKTDSVGSDVLFNLSPDNQLIATANFVDRDRTSFPTGSGGARYAVLKDLETSHSKDKQVGLTWTYQLSDKLSINSLANYFNRNEAVNSPAIVPGVTQGVPASQSDSELTRKSLSSVAVYEVSNQFSGAVGVDYFDESGVSHSLYDFGFPMPSGFDLQRSNVGAFAEVKFKSAQDLELFLSSRSDKPENHSQETSSKASLAYPLFGNNSRLGVSWGEAFKLPSFYALGDKLVGNEKLKSETSESTEVFYNQSFAKDLFHVNASVYRNEYRQLIDFDFQTFQLINRDKVFVRGQELEVVMNPTQALELGAHWMHNHFEIDDMGGPLNGRPETSSGIYAEYLSQSWSARFHLTHVGKRPSESTPTGPVELKAFNRVDSVFVKKILSDISLSLNFDNLLNEIYQDEVGFPSQGRRIRIGLSAQF